MAETALVAGDAGAPEPPAMDIQRQVTADLASELQNRPSLHTQDRRELSMQTDAGHIIVAKGNNAVPRTVKTAALSFAAFTIHGPD